MKPLFNSLIGYTKTFFPKVFIISFSVGGNHSSFPIDVIFRSWKKFLMTLEIRKGANFEIAVNAFNCWWSHLGSNQGPTDYESATLTN